MGATADPVEVVVTAADHATGLGTARAAAGAGIALTGLCSEPSAPTCRSRVWSRLVRVPGDDDRAFVEALLRRAQETSGPRVLLPADDRTVQLVSKHRDELAGHYHFVLPPAPVVDLLLDKTAFHGWASTRGFPVPETQVARSEADLAAILRDARFPVVLKPLVHTPEWEALSPGHKAYKLLRKEDLASIGFPPFAAASRYVVQRWIEGGDDCVHFCLTYVDAAGETAGVYTGRKLLQWLPQTGSTAICVGEPNPALVELTRALWTASGFRGLGSLEAKYCLEEGRYYITEPTVGRNNLQSGVAVAGGVNLTRLALVDALGGPAPKSPEARRAAWVNEPFAVRAVARAFAERKTERAALLGLARPARLGFAYLAWADPLPFFDVLRTALTRRVTSTPPSARPSRLGARPGFAQASSVFRRW
jgi:predicted ATP-grasp superfamily ATP-dependent carboligase